MSSFSNGIDFLDFLVFVAGGFLVTFVIVYPPKLEPPGPMPIAEAGVNDCPCSSIGHLPHREGASLLRVRNI
jgi:hypothetical protein